MKTSSLNLKNVYPGEEEIERLKRNIETFIFKNGDELTELY